MNKPTIGVFFGSRSAEHDVSIITALSAVIKPLKLTREYDVVPIYIAKDGRWFSDEKLAEVSFYSSGKIDEYLKKSKPIKLFFDNGLILQKGKRNKIRIDIGFPATHGTHGEDGELMSIFELANIPYVGCGVAASAIAMDKILAKQVTTGTGLPTTPWVWFTGNDYKQEPAKKIKRIEDILKYPIFVKPARLGSSIGVAKVSDATELKNAIEVALRFDDRIVIEQSVENLYEVTLPIMGNDDPKPALLEHPLTKPEDYYDFETKYIGGGKKGGQKSGAKRGAQGYSIIPAELPEKLYKKAETIALDVYKVLGCEGISRVDLLIDQKTEEVYFNEVNPLPGSLYAHNWRQAGISNVDLVTKLVDYAEQRWQAKQKLTTSFDTNFLKQF